jgi:hypothetical protein
MTAPPRRSVMTQNKLGVPNNSNVNRHYSFDDERHSEDYEQGEAINVFLELEATDNDYLAILAELTGFIYGKESMEYQLLRLAMGVPDKKEPSVDDFNDSNGADISVRGGLA